MKSARTIRLAVQVSFLTAVFAMQTSAQGLFGQLGQAATGALQGAGVINQNQAQAINQGTQAVAKSFEDITPEQEYYIGRAVAAGFLSTRKVYDVQAVTDYLNLLGTSLALASPKPETFGGYHFLAIDSDEINAFSAPGGLVLVTRGLLRCAQNEDEVAAILAHEISHVARQHGLKSIKKDRLTKAVIGVGNAAAQVLGPKELQEQTATFKDSVGDITSTVVNSGYSRDTEFEADADRARDTEGCRLRCARARRPAESDEGEAQAGRQRYGQDSSGSRTPHPAHRKGSGRLQVPDAERRHACGTTGALQGRPRGDRRRGREKSQYSPAAPGGDSRPGRRRSVRRALALRRARPLRGEDLGHARAAARSPRIGDTPDRDDPLGPGQPGLGAEHGRARLALARELYAAVADFCRRGGAKALAFDVLFTEPSTYGVSDDQRFADALRANGRAVGAMLLGSKMADTQAWPAGIPAPGLSIEGFDVWMARERPRGIGFPRAQFPIPELASSFAMLSNTNLPPDATDGVYRREPLSGASTVRSCRRRR